MLYYFKNKFKDFCITRDESKGFTLIELLTTVSIMSLIVAVIITNQNKYKDAVSLTILADDISSKFFQAQVYGASAKAVSTGSNIFNAGYGLSFNIATNSGSRPGKNTAYLNFIDKDDNKIYTLSGSSWDNCPLGGSSECIERTDILHGNTINKICTWSYNVVLTNPANCVSSGGIVAVDILFIRPNNAAKIKFINSAGNTISTNDATTIGAGIELKNPAGEKIMIKVYNSGQISVSDIY